MRHFRDDRTCQLPTLADQAERDIGRGYLRKLLNKKQMSKCSKEK
jgi:hypothetical protein